MKNYLIALVVVVVLGAGYFVFSSKSQPLGAYLTTTVTNASSTIGTATTSVYAAGANLQKLILTNTGVGNIYCAFGQGVDSVLLTGLHLNPVGSSTLTSVEITDYNLLGKPMNCISDASSKISILKY